MGNSKLAPSVSWTMATNSPSTTTTASWAPCPWPPTSSNPP